VPTAKMVLQELLESQVCLDQPATQVSTVSWEFLELKEQEVLLEKQVSVVTTVLQDQMVRLASQESQDLKDYKERQVPLAPRERRDGEVSEELLDHLDELVHLEKLVLMENEELLAVEDTPEPEVWPAQTVHQAPQEKLELQDHLETPVHEDHLDNPATEDQRDHQDHEVPLDQLSRSTSTHQRHFHPKDLHTDLLSTTTTTTTTTTNTTTQSKRIHESRKQTWICLISSMDSRSRYSVPPNQMAALNSQPNLARTSRCASLKPLQVNTGSILTVVKLTTK